MSLHIMDGEHFSKQEATEVQNGGKERKGEKAARFTAQPASEPKVQCCFFCFLSVKEHKDLTNNQN